MTAATGRDDVGYLGDELRRVPEVTRREQRHHVAAVVDRDGVDVGGEARVGPRREVPARHLARRCVGRRAIVVDQSYSGTLVEPFTIGATTATTQCSRASVSKLQRGDRVAQLARSKSPSPCRDRPSVTGKFDLGRCRTRDQRVDGDERRGDGEVVGQDQGGDVDDVARRRDREVHRVGAAATRLEAGRASRVVARCAGRSPAASMSHD